MNLPTALEQSCNTFFFQLGSKMYDLPNQGIAFQKTIREYGFGKTPPMDLPVSPYFSGLVPDPAWRLQTYSKPIDQVWQPGYDIQMAIGQGDLTVSPMQLAVAYSAIANGGKLVTPHIGKALLDSQGNVVKRFDPAPQRDLHLSPTLLSEIRQGLYEASHSSLGTSSSVFGNYTPAVAGKTGTAEHPPDPAPNAWFASFAPANNPKLVVVALINDGGDGGAPSLPGLLPPEDHEHRGNGHLPLMRTYLRHLDYMMLATALAITTYGLWILRNATRNDIPGDPTYYYNRQLGYAVVGVVGMLLISLVPPRLLRRINPLLYLFVVLTTMVVLVIGTSVQGGQRWINLGVFQFQPSELGKLLLIVGLAAWLGNRRNEWSPARLTLGALAYMALPALIVYAAVTLGMLFALGAPWRHFAWLGLAFVVTPAMVFSIMPGLGVPVIKQYQMDRLTAFLHPNSSK